MIETIILTLVAFTVTDYTLGRAGVPDPLRAVVAAVFAVVVFILHYGIK